MKPYFVLYTKKRCQWCRKAIDLLNEKKYPYIVTDVTKNKEILEEIKTVFSHKTVPIVLYADNDNSRLSLVGGYTELENDFDSIVAQESPVVVENVK